MQDSNTNRKTTNSVNYNIKENAPGTFAGSFHNEVVSDIQVQVRISNFQSTRHYSEKTQLYFILKVSGFLKVLASTLKDYFYASGEISK